MSSLLYAVTLVLMTQVSEVRIRQFIGTKTTRTLNGSSEANEPRGPLIKKAIDHLPSLGDVSTQNQQSDAVSDEEPALVPATVVWLRLSKQYLKEYIERTVDRKKLGARLHSGYDDYWRISYDWHDSVMCCTRMIIRLSVKLSLWGKFAHKRQDATDQRR